MTDGGWNAAKDVVGEAVRLVTGDRNEAYGDPTDDFTHIGDLWSAAIRPKLRDGEQLSPVDVAHMMILLKMARDLFQQPKRDSLVDMVGYTACLARIRYLQGDWEGSVDPKVEVHFHGAGIDADAVAIGLRRQADRAVS